MPDAANQIWTFRALTNDGSLATSRDQFAICLPRDSLTFRDVAIELNAVLARDGDFDVADGVVFSVVPLRDLIVGPAGRAIVILGGAVALLLLVACVNVMSLLVAREVGRQRDTAIRRALGASRSQIFRQTCWHLLLLTLAGSVVGLGAAWWEAGFLRALAPQSIAGIQHTQVDMTAVGVVVATALLAALGVAWRPAARAWATSDGAMLREGALVAQGGANLFRGDRGQAVLVAAQIALVVSLATGSGLLARSLVKLLAIDVGFEPRGLSSYLFQTGGSRAQQATALAELLTSVRALPGVTAASLSTLPPFLGLTQGTSFDVETRDGWKSARSVPIQTISAGYFQTMRIPMLQGRLISDTLRWGDTCEVIVNDAFARSIWLDESPLQRRIDLAQEGGAALPPRSNLRSNAHTTIIPWTDNLRFCTVVGVVGNIREKSLTEPAQERVYFSFYQRPSGNATLIVRTSGKPLSHANAIGATIRRVLPSQGAGFPLGRAIDDEMRRSVTLPAFYAWLFGTLAVTAVVLAVAGVFGMTWHAVVARSREIGIRLALGARPDQVVGMLVRSEGVPIAIGAVLGVGGAAVSTRYLTSLLHEVTPLDPPTFIVAPTIVTFAALAAVIIPAMRARSVDPTKLLRAQ